MLAIMHMFYAFVILCFLVTSCTSCTLHNNFKTDPPHLTHTQWNAIVHLYVHVHVMVHLYVHIHADVMHISVPILLCVHPIAIRA